MKNRREFLALMKGFGIGAAAGVVGIRSVPPSYDPIHVPNDRLPMVEHNSLGVTFTSANGEMLLVTHNGYASAPQFIDGYLRGKYDTSWPETA